MSLTPTVPRRPGFTLVEAAVSIVIVGVMFVAALSTVGAAAQGRRLQAEWRRADTLARALLYEVQQAKYGSTGGTIVPVVVLGVGVTDRSPLATLDDYNGLIDSPPRARDGSLLSDYTGWSRTVTIDRVDPADPFGASTRSTDKGLKRISVSIRTPTGAQSKLTAFRSRWSPADLEVAPGQTRAQAATIRIRLAGGTEIVSGALLPNGPQLTESSVVAVDTEPEGIIGQTVGAVTDTAGSLLTKLLGGGK